MHGKRISPETVRLNGINFIHSDRCNPDGSKIGGSLFFTLQGVLNAIQRGEEVARCHKKDGKRIAQRSFDFKRDAIEWENQQKKALKKAEKRQRTGLDLLTFCSKYLIYAERYSKKVYDEKKNACKRILTTWGAETLVDDITADHAEIYLLGQKNTRSANASNKGRKNLRAMWQKGVLTWGVERNPFALTEKFAHDRDVQYTPPSQDVLQVLMVANRKERVLLYAYIQTGARRSELYRWNWIDDINFEKRQSLPAAPKRPHNKDLYPKHQR